MNKPLAGCWLQRVAGERLPSLPGDQADDCPVVKGEGKKAPIINGGQAVRSLAEHSRSASVRRQLDSISSSASPATHIISPWLQQQKNACEGEGKAVAEKCKLEMKVISQMGSKGEERNATGRIRCWVLGEMLQSLGLEMGCCLPGFGLQGQSVSGTVA